MDVASAEMELLGEFTAGLVIFGDADTEPLLGVTALESAGIEIDPQNQRLKKLPSVRFYATDSAWRGFPSTRNLSGSAVIAQTRVTDALDFSAGRLKRAAEGVAVGGGGEQRARHVAIAHAYDLQTLGA